jgi:hypothetical protein
MTVTSRQKAALGLREPEFDLANSAAFVDKDIPPDIARAIASYYGK